MTLRSLSQRYSVDERKLRALLDLLVADPLAPTTIKAEGAVLSDHLADSLVGLELEEVRAAGSIADLGSGPGVPGLPLAIAMPQTEVFLVESVARKCAFIERAVAVCGLANAHVVHARAEAWPEGLARFDLVTARALAALPVVAEYGAPLLCIGGTLVVWRGRRDPEEERAGAQAAAELGLSPREPIAVQPYPGASNRHLHLMLKVSETPQRFPRRPGMAAKRPLARSTDTGPSNV